MVSQKVALVTSSFISAAESIPRGPESSSLSMQAMRAKAVVNHTVGLACPLRAAWMGSPGYGSLIGLPSVHATRTLGLGQRHMPVEAFQERKRAARHQTLLRILSASTDSCWLRSCTDPNCVLSAAAGVQTNGTPGMLIRLLAVVIFIMSETMY
ncbi:hypothetical protein TgHK011_008641 [Trichoderma gracile]|nr:hypothetical protein TgHK011_008641 [Trichoderma gracile]